MLKSRLCKYCDKSATKNIRPNGINKGYYRTCGSKECLTKQYFDPIVSSKKRYRGKAICLHCKKEYMATSSSQKWCFECAPDKSTRRILQRYGLSPIEHKHYLETNQGLCFICRKRPAKVVDHCHKTGKVRGLLCYHCNTALCLIEDKNSLNRALQYLEANNESIQIN